MLPEFLLVMKALSDPNRVRILKLLQQRELCVCELQEALNLAQSSISKHMKALDEAGLVTASRQGLWVIYRQADGQRSPYAATLLGNLRHWLTEEPEVAAVLRRLADINRETICRGEAHRRAA